MTRPLLVTALCLASLARADFGPALIDGAQAGRQEWPDVARREGRSLVAWKEPSMDPKTSARATFSVRFEGGGPVQRVGEAQTQSSPPTLVACPDGFALAWAERDQTTVTFLDGEGRPRNSASVPTGAQGVGGPASRPAFGCDARGAFLAWAMPGKAQLFGARVGGGADGTPAVLFADDAPGSWSTPALASGPDGYRLVWLSGAALLTGNVGLDGKPKDRGPTEVAKATQVGTPAIARSANGHFAVVWDAQGINGPVRAVRLSPQGQPLDPEPLVLSKGPAWSAAVSAEGDAFQVAWVTWTATTPMVRGDEGAQLAATKLPAGKGAPGPAFVLHAGESNADQVRLAPGLAVFTEGVALAAASTHTSASLTDVWAKKPGSPAVLITVGPGQHRSPAMAARGAETLLVWVDDHGHPESIRAGRISGGKLVGELQVHRGAPSRGPVVAAGAPGWLVAWTAPQAIYAVRVSPSGELVDATPLKVGTGAPGVSAAWDGEAWALAWRDNNRVVSVRVPGAGPLGELGPAKVGDDTFGNSRVALACDAPACLAAWHTAYQQGAAPVAQRMPRGRPELTAQYPQAIDASTGANATLAAGSGSFFFGWTEGKGEGRQRVVARRVPALGGRPGDRLEFASDASGTPLTAAFDGRRFALGWEVADARDSLRWAWEDGRAQGLGVHGSALALSGTGGGGLFAAWVEDNRVRVRELLPHNDRPAGAAPALPPVRLSELFTLASAAATTASARVDPLGELMEKVQLVVRHVQAATARGALPVALSKLSSTRGTTGPIVWSPPEGGSMSTGAASTISVVDGRFVGKSCTFAAVYGSLVICDGPVRAGSVNHSVIIATGDVSLAHVDSTVVIARGRIDVSGDGSGLAYGRGTASVFLSASRIDGGFQGSVLGAADGVRLAGHNNPVTVNTVASRPVLEGGASAPGLTLDEGVPSPLSAGLRATLQEGELPDRAGVWLSTGQPDGPEAFVREGQAVPLPGLEGWRVGFVTPTRVVLRKKFEVIVLEPGKQRRAPPKLTLQVPADAEIHQVGAYSATRADSTIEVSVDRPGVPVLLVLGAYEAVTWDLKLSKGTTVVGVLLGGYKAPEAVLGLAPGTPVVTRVFAYGEPYFFDYPKGPGTAPSTDPNTGGRECRALTDRLPKSFAGGEKLDRAEIH